VTTPGSDVGVNGATASGGRAVVLLALSLSKERLCDLLGRRALG
jgi:hypothetical protein